MKDDFTVVRRALAQGTQAMNELVWTHATLFPEKALDRIEEQNEMLRQALGRVQQFAEGFDDEDEGYVWLKTVCREALNPANSPDKAGGWCERHGGYLGRRCATCALESQE